MLKQLKQQYETALFDSVIPFWLEHSLDREHGGYFTCLDRDGAVYDTSKYVWLQGRQVWMLSRLYNEVEHRSEWLEAATLGVNFLLAHAFDPKGRCYFRLTREGEPIFYQRKPYGAVFVALALLEYSKTGGADYLQEAVDLFWRIQEWIAKPALMDRPSFDTGPEISQLADIMVLASLAIELDAAHDDPRYCQVMRECLDKVFRHHDPQRHILRETASLDGVDLTHLPEGRLFNPGHSIEVAWFLLHLLDRHPDPDREKQALGIIEGTLDFGWDHEHGGLFYFMDIEDRPTLQLESSMKLWWPHTEALYALLLAFTRTGETKWLQRLEQVNAYTFGHFDDPEFGEWFGYCDRRGERTHTLKGNNYKGCFHVPRFLLMSIQEIERWENNQSSPH